MKKPFSVLLSVAMAVSSAAIMPLSASAATVVETMPYDDFSTSDDFKLYSDGGAWLEFGASKVADGVLSVIPNGSNATGPAVSFNYLNSNYAKYGFCPEANSSVAGYWFEQAWAGSSHVFKTRMSVSEVGDTEGVFTSIVGTRSTDSTGAAPNCWNSATNLVLLEKNSGDDTFSLKINLTSAGYNAPSTVVYDNVKVGQWIDVCLLMTGSRSSEVTYYIDGKNVGTANIATNSLALNSAIRMRTQGYDAETSSSAIQAQFDDMALTSVSKSDGAIPFDITSASTEGGKATIHFASEVYDTIKSALIINGEAVSADKVTILPDQKSVLVDGVNSTDFYVRVKDGTTDVYGTAASGISYKISGDEKLTSGKVDWVAYEDFSDFDSTGWYDRSSGSSNISSVASVDEDSTLTIVSGEGQGMSGIKKKAADFGIDKYISDSNADYKMVVKAKMSAKSHTSSNKYAAAAELSFATDFSTKKKLFQLLPTNEENSTSFKVVADSDCEAGEVALGEWVDVAAVGNIADGQESWTYYVNGAKVTKDGSDTFVSDNILGDTANVNYIQFASRGVAEAGFDDIAVYVIVNPEKDFTVYETTGMKLEDNKYTVDYAAVNISDKTKTLNVYFAEYSLSDNTLTNIKKQSCEVPANGIAPLTATFTKTGGIETEVKIYAWDEAMAPILDIIQDSNLPVTEADENPFDLAQRMLTASSAEKTTFSDDGYVTIINDVTSEAKASAAAYTCGGNFKDTNFSASDEIIIKNDPESWGTARKGYLEFDISSVNFPGVSSAFIKLYCTDIQDNEPHYVSAYECSGEWAESAITWNTAPAAGGLLSKTYIITPNKWYYFDVTDYVNTCLAQGKNPSFVLQDDAALRTNFASKSSVNAPRLILVDASDNISPAKDDFSEYNQIVQAQRWTGDSYKSFLSRDLSSLAGFEPSVENAQLSEYGGNIDKHFEATGNFYVIKNNGRWHMVDPDGYDYFNLGVASVEPGSSKAEVAGREAAYSSIADWADGTSSMLINDFGFNGAGGWSDLTNLHNAEQPLNTTEIAYFLKYYMRSLGLDNSTNGNTTFANNNTMNVFDPGFVDYCDKVAKAQADKYKDNPSFIGWMSDNELPDDINLLDRYLALDYTDERNIYSYVTAWEWLYDYLGTKNPSPSEITDIVREDFREFVYDRYFYVVSSALKKYAPNKLYLGARHAGAESSGIMTAAGRYCDVVTINYYGAWTPESGLMAQWSSWTGRPFIITEWYAMAYDSGLACTTGAGFRVATQADRGKFYQNYALKLLQTKNCVGFHWFKYLDNDPEATNRDASNIDGNKGIVNISFQPYTELTNRMRTVNINAYKLIEYFDGR